MVETAALLEFPISVFVLEAIVDWLVTFPLQVSAAHIKPKYYSHTPSTTRIPKYTPDKNSQSQKTNKITFRQQKYSGLKILFVWWSLHSSHPPVICEPNQGLGRGHLSFEETGVWNKTHAQNTSRRFLGSCLSFLSPQHMHTKPGWESAWCVSWPSSLLAHSRPKSKLYCQRNQTPFQRILFQQALFSLRLLNDAWKMHREKLTAFFFLWTLDTLFCTLTCNTYLLQYYRWVTLYPNTFNSKLDFMYPKRFQNHISMSTVLLRMLNSKFSSSKLFLLSLVCSIQCDPPLYKNYRWVPLNLNKQKSKREAKVKFKKIQQKSLDFGKFPISMQNKTTGIQLYGFENTSVKGQFRF